MHTTTDKMRLSLDFDEGEITDWLKTLADLWPELEPLIEVMLRDMGKADKRAAIDRELLRQLCFAQGMTSDAYMEVIHGFDLTLDDYIPDPEKAAQLQVYSMLVGRLIKPMLAKAGQVMAAIKEGIENRQLKLPPATNPESGVLRPGEKVVGAKR